MVSLRSKEIFRGWLFCICASGSGRGLADSCPVFWYAYFVGFNWPLRGTIWLAEKFSVSNP